MKDISYYKQGDNEVLTYMRGVRHTFPMMKRVVLSPEAQLAKQATIEALEKGAHYTAIATNVLWFKKTSFVSERVLAKIFDLSKSEVHRLLKIANLPNSIKMAAVKFNIEKYVMFDLLDVKNVWHQNDIHDLILKGGINCRSKFKAAINAIMDSEKNTETPS